MKSSLLFLTLVAIITAQQTEYNIPGFSSGGRAFPQQGNEIILPDSGENLTEITALPQLSGGEVVLRRRFDATEYRLYKGRFSPGAFNESNNLYIFQRPEMITINDAAEMKWYKEKTGNPDLDEADIYFDSKKMYISFLPRLFYNDGTSWKSIDAINLSGDKKKSRPMGDIQITSTPAHAEIFIDGKSTGVFTPNYITDLFEGMHKVTLQLKNHQAVDTTVER
jgi:hypothetical protein